MPMPWYFLAPLALIPVVVIHYLRSPRERRREFVRKFLRVDVWALFAGVVFFWANERFEWWATLQHVPDPVWWSFLLSLLLLPLLWRMRGSAEHRRQFVQKFLRVDGWILLVGLSVLVVVVVLLRSV